MSEIEDHAAHVRQRLTDANHSTLELRQIVRKKHEALMDPANGADREMIICEIQVVDSLLEEKAPPPLSPAELVAQLPESDPRRSALEHTLQRAQLAQDVEDARAYAEAHPTSDRGKERLEDAQKELAELGIPQFAQDIQDARQFRTKAETLQQRVALATTEEERIAIEAEAQGFFDKANALELNRPPPPAAPQIPSAPESDPVAAAEAAVDAAMAADG